MSWEAVKHVMDSSRSTDTDRLVLLALAEAADRDTWDTWIGLETIGHKAGGKSERSVQRALKRLAEMGELDIDLHGAPQRDRKFQYRSNLYRITRSSGDTCDTSRALVVTPVVSSGDTGGHLVVTRVTPNPEVEPEVEPSSEIGDEIEAGLDLAAERIVDEQIRGGTVVRNRTGYQRTTRENLRKDFADVITHARRETWTSEQLADKIAPKPYVEHVARGADQLIYKPDGSYWKRCYCDGNVPDCIHCGGVGELLDSTPYEPVGEVIDLSGVKV